MGIPFWKCITALTMFLVLSLHIANVHGLAVMSIDIGSEWMKVAIVSVSITLKINDAQIYFNVLQFYIAWGANGNSS